MKTIKNPHVKGATAFSDEVYSANIIVLPNCSEEQERSFVDWMWPDTHWSDAASKFTGCAASTRPVWDVGGVLHVVVSFTGRDFSVTNPQDLSIVVHECLHITEAILFPKGLKHTEETSEAWAYMLDSIFRKVMKVLTHSKP